MKPFLFQCDTASCTKSRKKWFTECIVEEFDCPAESFLEIIHLIIIIIIIIKKKRNNNKNCFYFML